MNSLSGAPLRRWIGPLVLLGTVLGAGALLAAWKHSSSAREAAGAASFPEPVELVTVAPAVAREYRPTTTAIGTVLALRSISLRNELAGTVRQVSLRPGAIVEPGEVLVALDVSVEAADLEAQEAEAALARTTLARLERLRQHEATSQEEVDQARARLEVAEAQIARTRAIIAKKTIRAPFRARVGIADVHPGQYLNEGTELTTLQGVSDAVHVDFAVAQRVAANLREGMTVTVVAADEAKPVEARILAIDARVDPTTRNAMVRARLGGSAHLPAPGASVKVQVPSGAPSSAVAIPVSALRRGPGGDQVWVIAADSTGARRAHARAVESGPVLGDTVLILAGLSPGEEVAATGSFKLREAVRVEAASSPTAAAGATR